MSKAKSRNEAGKQIILCGTDFSVHASEAADAAAAIAVKTGDDLVLVHVAEARSAAERDAAHPRHQRAVQDLGKEAERLRTQKISVREELLFGSPYEVMAEAARRLRARFVVVASIGWVSPTQWFVGSTAERIAEVSPVPVLVVRNSSVFQKWAKQKHTLKLLVGVDFSHTANSALQAANVFSSLGACEVNVLHVNWPPSDWRRFGYTGNRGMVGNPDEIQEVLLRDLKEKSQQHLLRPPNRVMVEPSWGRIDFEMTAVAEREHADIIVVGTHQRRGVSKYWLGSVSRGLLHHAPLNIIIVPATRSISTSLPIPAVRRILVTTDFSAVGNAAIPHAYSVLPRGGVVRLLHVLSPARGRSATARASIRTADEKLRQLIPENATDLEIETEVEVVEHERPALAICQSAERMGADLICIASHGASRLTKRLLGSVAQEVMSCSRRPVLVIRRGDT